MTTDESIMVEMLERATTPDKDNDELSIQMFCIVVKSNHSLIHRAQELIVDTIKTLNTRKAVKAIHLLEECMTKCGNDFQDECAKFRFLNELIRLVSKKYQGSETPKEIKQRIMECLLLWTTEFPNKVKIREAYDMLFKEGCVDNNEGFSSNAAKRECVLGIDENMLSKLLKSGNPEDLKRANLHIQHRVNQEARRTELILQHKKELQEIQTIISLLNQMLDSDSQNDPDVQETIKELFETCNRHKPVLKRMPELLESTNEDLIAETLDVNDLLQEALNRYKKKYMQTNNGESDTISNSADLLSELFDSSLKDTKIGDEPQKQAVLNSSSLTDSLQELTKIFGSEFTTNSSTAKISTPKSPNELFPLFPEVLQPSKITETKHSPENHDLKVGSAQEQKQVPFALNDIDKLSEELLKKSLNHTEIVGQFTKELKKPTLNDLANLKPLEHSHQTSEERNPEDTNFKKHIVGIPKGSKETNIDEQTENIKEHLTEFEKLVHVKHLSEVNVELDEIVPTTEVRMLVDDNDLEFKLVFTDSRPAKNVSVFVLTGTNKSQLTMSDFHIDASVKKPCKVRLLPLSDSTLHPSKPFRPSTPINQILLLLNASGGNVDITFLLSYKMGDDPDPVKDSIVAKDIPYVD